MDAETALPTRTCSTRKSSYSRPFPFRRPCNGGARTRNPAWLSAPAVRNGGACGAAIRAARVLKHMPAPRSSSNTFVPRPPLPSGHAPWDTSAEHDTTVGNDPNPSQLTDGPRHALRQGERILAPVVSAVIWVSEESFGMTLPGGATDPDSRPLLGVPAATAPKFTLRTPVWLYRSKKSLLKSLIGLQSTRSSQQC